MRSRHKAIAPISLGISALFLHGAVGAQEPVKTCPAVEVRSLEFSHIIGEAMLSWIDQPKIETISVHSENGKQRDSGKNEAVIIAYGPVLGSMDSSSLSTSLACTSNGIAIDVTIIRSAYYNGSVLANINWVPKAEIRVTSDQPEMTIDVKWKMVLSNGATVSESQTPAYPLRSYPVPVSKVIRWQ